MKNKTNKNLKLDKIQISQLYKLETIKGGNSSKCTDPLTTKTVPTDLDI